MDYLETELLCEDDICWIKKQGWSNLSPLALVTIHFEIENVSIAYSGNIQSGVIKTKTLPYSYFAGECSEMLVTAAAFEFRKKPNVTYRKELQNVIQKAMLECPFQTHNKFDNPTLVVLLIPAYLLNTADIKAYADLLRETFLNDSKCHTVLIPYNRASYWNMKKAISIEEGVQLIVEENEFGLGITTYQNDCFDTCYNISFPGPSFWKEKNSTKIFQQNQWLEHSLNWTSVQAESDSEAYHRIFGKLSELFQDNVDGVMISCGKERGGIIKCALLEEKVVSNENRILIDKSPVKSSSKYFIDQIKMILRDDKPQEKNKKFHTPSKSKQPVSTPPNEVVISPKRKSNLFELD